MLATSFFHVKILIIITSRRLFNKHWSAPSLFGINWKSKMFYSAGKLPNRKKREWKNTWYYRPFKLAFGGHTHSLTISSVKPESQPKPFCVESNFNNKSIIHRIKARMRKFFISCKLFNNIVLCFKAEYNLDLVKGRSFIPYSVVKLWIYEWILKQCY